MVNPVRVDRVLAAPVAEDVPGDLRCWQVASQYLNLHLTHRGALWASGAAQAAQVVRIILRFAVSYWGCAAALRASLTRLGKPDFFSPKRRATLRLDAVVDAAIDMVRRLAR